MADTSSDYQRYQSLDQWKHDAKARGFEVVALHRLGELPLRFEARTEEGLEAGEFHRYMTPIFTRGVLALTADRATNVPALERYADTQFNHVNSRYPKAMDLSWL